MRRRYFLQFSLLLTAPLAACEDPAGQAQAAQTCAAPVQLAVGESADLSADAEGTVRCRLQGDDDAEYVVAFVDTRATQKARTASEGYGGAFSPYTVSVALDDNVPQVPSAQLAARPRTIDFHAQQAAPPPASGVLRETPWTLGERFDLYDGYTQTPRPARVLRIYDGRFVFAWLEGENEPQLAAFLAQLDSAWATVREHARPLMRAAYSSDDPLTSPGSGQYLTVLRALGRGEAAGWTVSSEEFGAPRLWTEIKVRPGPSHLTQVELLAHEFAHAYQALYMYRTRPGGVGSVAAGAAFWGVEGGADLVSHETVRRAAGVSLTANLDPASVGGGPPARQRAAVLERTNSGQLTEGYASSAAFLRLQAALLVRAGESPEAAVTEVLRGASDGWFGYDHLNARRTGLAERMRARLGAGWNPEDALLDWALAHAADDRTSNPRFQDPTYLRAGRVPGSSGSWNPFATLPGAGSIQSSTTRAYGSPDYLVVHAGRGEPFAAASSVPGLRWRVLRVR